jgi:hypothetical protein
MSADLRGPPLMQRDRKGRAEWVVLLASDKWHCGALERQYWCTGQ